MAQLNLGKVALTYDDLTEAQKDELRGEQGLRGEPGIQYGTCSTTSDIASKAVTITDFELKEGVTVMVNFTNANTAENPTLNVTNTGDIPIMNGSDVVDKNLIEARKIYSFTYNGANWQITSSAGGGDGVTAIKITQSEYDALSDEEKNSGMYIITDAYSDGVASNVGYSNTTSGLTATDVQGAIDEVDGKIDTIEGEVSTLQTDVETINSNLSELLNCKNEEQIIGTLFGKTLYRRVLFIEKEDKSAITGKGSFDLTSLFNFNLGDVDILKNMYMCGYKRGTQAYMLGNSNNNSNNNYSNMAAIWINPSGHSMLNYTFGEYFISTNYIVITLEYTKL